MWSLSSSGDSNIDQSLRTTALAEGRNRQNSLLSTGSVFLARKKKFQSQSSLPPLRKAGEGPNFSEIRELCLLPNPKFGVKEEASCWMGKGQ